ncbi:thymidylate kinase [Temnothorax curvispinosus]|uniref:Thymidylate kinase n=1 Tax=Temnothorax curvispinosus TaxID=300111 RepID=A0A6J1QQL9_9HYME|nr:thymidylate kinase [Temnothorax curvispinosus]
MYKRGALIVLEGCDRAGKSTQVKMLMNALNDLNILAKARAFPNRKTPVGTILNSFLSKEINVPPEAAHLLFSANRWECKEDMEKTLRSGVTLIMDRYAASGAAYTAANTSRSINWCQQADMGLPKPDCVVFLKVSKRQQELRSDWGKERFEHDEFQQRVDANYEKLKDDTWIVINADQDESAVHAEILQKTLSVIQEVQYRDIELLDGANIQPSTEVSTSIQEPSDLGSKLILSNLAMIKNLEDQLSVSYQRKIQNIPKGLSQDLVLQIQIELDQWKESIESEIKKKFQPLQKVISFCNIVLKNLGELMESTEFKIEIVSQPCQKAMSDYNSLLKDIGEHMSAQFNRILTKMDL